VWVAPTRTNPVMLFLRHESATTGNKDVSSLSYDLPR